MHRVGIVDVRDALFQSAPPHGGRRRRLCSLIRSVAEAVSIRAPARGATHPLLRVGPGVVNWFQSAPPHGGRRSQTLAEDLTLPVSSFNPRPRTGGD